MSDERLDNVFIGLAQQAQGIEPLLEAFFGFLRRRTDFFTGASEQQVQDVVMKAVSKQAVIAKEEAEKKKKREEERRRQEEEKRRRVAEEKAKQAAEAAAAKGDGVLRMGPDGVIDASAEKEAAPEAQKAPEQPKAAEDTKADDAESGSSDKQAPVNNGGITSKYRWTQTLKELTVTVPLPPGITKGRDVAVEIKKSHLKFGIRGQAPIVDAPTPGKRKLLPDESSWTIEDEGKGKALVLYLFKENGMDWWDAVAEGEPQIDTSKVDPENSKLGDLDADTRATVEKMMFDQRQKMMGQPTSDEMQKQEALKRFMAQHPEMDFSNAKIT